MTRFHARPVFTVGFAVLLVVSAVAVPAAAGNHGNGPDDRASDDGTHHNADGGEEYRGHSAGHATTNGNSTTHQHLVVVSGENGGYFLMDCTGVLTSGAHACDKRGTLDAGVVAIDYTGNNYADPPGLAGGGGDEVTVTVGDQHATGEFDCTLRTETLPAPCTVNASSSATGGVSVPN